MKKISVTGIKPTGSPHLGNYLAVIKPALALADQYQSLFFVADYHALTSLHEAATLTQYVYQVTAAWLALGLEGKDVIFYRQSDVPQILELNWILSCYAAKGWLNRAHAYKSATENNLTENKERDADINMGLYNYPVLMAADILAFGSHVVPVGQDQIQHIEITRNIASTINHHYGAVFTLPEALVQPEVMVIPGIDGRKMSKSYDNTIPVFLPSDELRKRIMRIVTDSKRPEEPKDPDQCNVFGIYRYFVSPEEENELRQAYGQGGVGYAAMKGQLYQKLEAVFEQPRKQYNELINDRNYLDKVLSQGAEKATALADPILNKVKVKIGIKSRAQMHNL